MVNLVIWFGARNSRCATVFDSGIPRRRWVIGKANPEARPSVKPTPNSHPATRKTAACLGPGWDGVGCTGRGGQIGEQSKPQRTRRGYQVWRLERQVRGSSLRQTGMTWDTPGGGGQIG